MQYDVCCEPAQAQRAIIAHVTPFPRCGQTNYFITRCTYMQVPRAVCRCTVCVCVRVCAAHVCGAVLVLVSPNVTTDWVPGLEGILVASSLTLLLSRVFTHCRHFTAIKSTPCRVYSRLRAQAGRSIKRILPRTTAHC